MFSILILNEKKVSFDDILMTTWEREPDNNGTTNSAPMTPNIPAVPQNYLKVLQILPRINSNFTLGCDSKFRCAYFYAGCGGLFLPTLLFLSAGVYFW